MCNFDSFSPVAELVIASAEASASVDLTDSAWHDISG